MDGVDILNVLCLKSRLSREGGDMAYDSVGNEADAIEGEDRLDSSLAFYPSEDQAGYEKRRDIVIFLEQADLTNREKTEGQGDCYREKAGLVSRDEQKGNYSERDQSAKEKTGLSDVRK